jgi:hypothetical protein
MVMGIKRYRSGFCALVTVIIVLLLSSSGYAASEKPGWQTYESQEGQALLQYVLTDPIPAGEPLTLSTRVKVDLSGESSAFGSSSPVPEQIVLAGVSLTAGEEPTTLAIAWQLDVSSWFPTWHLYLISDAGLLHSSGQRLKLDAEIIPVGGEEYETLFSLDPTTGTLSVRVINITMNAVAYAGNMQVRPLTGALYPGAGAQSTDAVNPTRLAAYVLKAQRDFIPVGAKAQMKARLSGTNFLAAMRALDRRDEWVLDTSLPQLALDNSLLVTFEDDHQKAVLIDLKGITGNQLIEIDPTSLPAGQLEMVLSYIIDGQSWEISRTPLKVGAASVAVQDVRLGTDAQGQPTLLGTIEVTGDGPLPSFNVYLSYELSAPGAISPLNSQWKKQVGEAVVHVDTDKELSFRVPLQAVAGFVEKNELFVKISATSDLELPFSTDGLDRFVVGERPAAFPQVGSYTVLRGDFHTHSTESDGDLSPADRVWETYMYGYDILALTDHRTMTGYDRTTFLADRLGLILVRGFETGINGQEHLVVLGVDEDYKLRDEHQWARNPNEARVYYQDQVREVINHGGYIIYAHPGGTWLPPGPYSHPDGAQGWTDEIEWIIKQGYIRGVESRGAYAAARRNAPYRWALEYGLTLFDVTDIHGARDFNAANQAPMTLVFVEDASANGVLDALRDGRTLIYRSDVLRGTATWLQPFLAAVLDIQLVEHNGEPAVQLTNTGALALYGWATPNGGNQQSFWLTPFGTVYISCPANAESLNIRWGNVQSGPDQLYNSVFSLQ